MERNKKTKLIVYIFLLICLFSLFFVNVFSIRVKFDGVNYYSNIKLFDLIVGYDMKFLLEDNNTLTSFYLSNCFLIDIFIGSIFISFISFILGMFIRSNNKYFYYISSISSLLSITILILIPLLIPYIYHLESNLTNYKDVNTNNIFFISLIGILIGILIINASNIPSKEKTFFSTYDLAEMAILVALALVLDWIKISVGTTGGSINLSALPLMIYAYRRGPLKGLIASSIVFGLLSNIFDGYGIITYPFDYLIAFSGYSLIGLYVKLFKNLMDKDKKHYLIYFNVSIVLGGISAFITRMFGSTLSSIIIYEYNLRDALAYNILYIPLSSLSSTLAFCILSYPLMDINKKFPVK